MTREEYFERWNLQVTGLGKVILTNKYIDFLEQRIKELETPKKCDDCIHYDGDFEIYPCSICSYAFNDMYEPRE